MALLFAFAPEGACQATLSPRCWWSLTPPFQLFSHPLARAAGVFFSAALSVGSPRQAVSLPPALWSPDFPHGTCVPRGRLAHFAGLILACQPRLRSFSTGWGIRAAPRAWMRAVFGLREGFPNNSSAYFLVCILRNLVSDLMQFSRSVSAGRKSVNCSAKRK